eukprot:NODE_19_length_47148_cov_1.447810.p41 type:complete len:113 gc:universal NODE_19_length_47148_cov_1.447810:36537-36199(-)
MDAIHVINDCFSSFNFNIDKYNISNLSVSFFASAPFISKSLILFSKDLLVEERAAYLIFNSLKLIPAISRSFSAFPKDSFNSKRLASQFLAESSSFAFSLSTTKFAVSKSLT